MRNIGAVVLAAGESSRLGQPKQLLTFRGETLIQRVVRAAAEAGCEPIVVIVADIVGETRDAIQQALAIRDSRIAPPSSAELTTVPMLVENSEWRRGIGTSIRCGLKRMPEAVEAVVLLTCDQPFLDAAIVRDLIAAGERTGKAIVASSYANTLGIPALFHRSCFDALLALPDETGAKQFILSRRDEVAEIAFSGGEIDIDTPEDLKRLEEL